MLRTFNNFAIQLLLYLQLFLSSIKGTDMGTIFVAVGSNIMVAYFEEKMFAYRFVPKTFLTFFFVSIFDF